MIENKKDEIIQWKSVATSINAKTDGERVQSSGSKERMADAVISYVDIEREISLQIIELQKRKLEILSVIEKLNASEYEVLYEVYVNGKTLEEFAIDTGISERWAYTLHGIALKNTQDFINTSK